MILNKYGLLRLNYLKEHKKADYIIMFMNKTLNKHLKEVQETAKARVDILIKKFVKQDNINEELKAKDQLEWVQMMNNAEFVENEDENVEKQDCEIRAFYRMAKRIKEQYPKLQ